MMKRVHLSALAAMTVILSCSLPLLFAPRSSAGAASSPPVLSTQEEQLAKQTGFDPDIVKIVKQDAAVPIHRLAGYDENGYQVMVNGLSVLVPHSRAEQVRTALRDRLATFACLVFYVEIDDRIKRDRIGIIKGIDQFAILRVMQTNGEEDEVTNDEIVDRLREWNRHYPFEIIGAENDWVELEFSVLPKDLKAFAEEVNDFSPGTVEEGTGTIADLIAELKRTKRMVLLWN